MHTLAINPQKVAMKTVRSTCIAEIGYDKPSRTAVVKFQSGGLYTYANLHPTTVTRWLKSRSIGRYFHRNVRNHYDYQRIA